MMNGHMTPHRRRRREQSPVLLRNTDSRVEVRSQLAEWEF